MCRHITWFVTELLWNCTHFLSQENTYIKSTGQRIIYKQNMIEHKITNFEQSSAMNVLSKQSFNGMFLLFFIMLITIVHTFTTSTIQKPYFLSSSDLIVSIYIFFYFLLSYIENVFRTKNHFHYKILKLYLKTLFA